MNCDLACGTRAELVTYEYFGRELRVCRLCVQRVECQRCHEPPGILGTCSCAPHAGPKLPTFVRLGDAP